jgi:hypothetical protein
MVPTVRAVPSLSETKWHKPISWHRYRKICRRHLISDTCVLSWFWSVVGRTKHLLFRIRQARYPHLSSVRYRTKPIPYQTIRYPLWKAFCPVLAFLHWLSCCPCSSCSIAAVMISSWNIMQEVYRNSMDVA